MVKIPWEFSPKCAILPVNREMVLLYFKIGESILKKQEEEGWGTKITQRISHDLSTSFPEMTGLSYTNVRYMQRFAELCISICPQPAGKLAELPFFEIPWGHNREIMDSIKDLEQRLWYAQQIIKNGWSRNVLMHQRRRFNFNRNKHLRQSRSCG